MPIKFTDTKGLAPVLAIRQLADRIVIEYDLQAALTDDQPEIFTHIQPHISELFRAAAEYVSAELAERALVTQVRMIVADAKMALGLRYFENGGHSMLDLVADKLPDIPLDKLQAALLRADIGYKPGKVG